MTDAGFPDYTVQLRTSLINQNIPDLSYIEVKGQYFRIESGVYFRLGQGSRMKVTT